jgi:hypothetical protein
MNSLRVSRKGGRRDALAINPQTAHRVRRVAAIEPKRSGVFPDHYQIGFATLAGSIAKLPP